MMAFSLAVFTLSLLGIVALFYFKYRELHTGRGVIPMVRAGLDVRATQLKELIRAAQSDLRRLPPVLLHFSRISLHALALYVARWARIAERQAHRLADLVSYKHRFERRAPRSEFLQKIMDHKNGTGVEVKDDTVHNSEASQ